MYRVTRHFISGPMQGLTITQITRVSFTVGRTYTPCAGASDYIVTSCVGA